MIRAILCGGDELASAAATLGLVVSDDQPQIAILDLRDLSALEPAARLPPQLPRIVVAPAEHLPLLRALGIAPHAITGSCEPAALGPLVAAAVPATRRATRLVVVTASRGGVGRTLLVANLARRLAHVASVVAVDLTGSGSLAWWLRASAAPWTDLESLSGELSAEHLAVVAIEPVHGLRVLGGPPRAPTPALARAAVAAAADLADLVLVDAPLLADERTASLVESADRALELAYDDPASLALLPPDPSEGTWLIASQSRATRLGGREVFRALPRDEGAVADAIRSRAGVGGALGRAIDDIAELLAIDATA